MFDRRRFLGGALAAGILPSAAWSLGSETRDVQPGDGLHVAPFRFDVTPPLGHPLCGGWITPVVGYDDPLDAIGFVLMGAGPPIVVCTVDWTGILNDAYSGWCAALAEAAGTTPDRVTVHCVHQHNAPFACTNAQQLLDAAGSPTSILDLAYFEQCLDRARQAVKRALPRAERVTHVATGQARVERIAGNRRHVDAAGKLLDWRGSASRNPAHRELPEGLIDPWLKTVALCHGPRRLVACHYYATHPMSYYGDGRPSADFAGLARRRRQQEDPGCVHLYFTGCAGNVAAGKYNDGSPLARRELTDRLYAGLVNSDAEAPGEPVGTVEWRTREILPPPRDSLAAEDLRQKVNNLTARTVERNRPAYMLAWLERCQQGRPLRLSSLRLANATLLHLPAESFVEYQLRAQQLAPERFVATAAYSDGGPWYIPTRDAYPQGGYEVSMAFADPSIDDVLSEAIRGLV